MKHSVYFLSLIFLVLACENQNEQPPTPIKESKKVKARSDTSIVESQIKDVKIPLLSKADSLLIDPFDFIEFKKKKRGANSGGGGQKEGFYYRPEVEGMFYSYFLFGGGRREGYLGKDKNNKVRLFNSTEMRVYKPKDDDWNMYNDPNEILIEFEATCNDEDLPELAFVGWTKSQIIEELGPSDFMKHQTLVYTHQQRALLLHINGNTVDWLKYIRLNIDLDSNSNVPNLYKLDMFQF